MTRTLIRNIHIEQVYNLRNVNIDLEALGGRPRHLIITGKNGSGKTMLLNSIAGYLSSVCEGECPSEIKKLLADTGHDLVDLHGDPAKNETAIRSLFTTFKDHESRLEAASHGINLVFSVPDTEIHRLWQEGDCILAHFTAYRSSETIVPEHKEKDPLAESYAVDKTPRDQLARYFLNLKMTQTLAIANGRKELAAEIGRWFDRVRDICREVYEDPTLELDFDVETFRFSISRQGREPHDLNGASDGLSALLDIIFNLLLRMVRKNGHSTEFDLPGIALIDEVEAHLHLSLQRRVLPILTGLFPNVQFVVTTHSPFVLSSTGDATLFDLDTSVFVRDGLVDSTYESIVEGYFNVDALSEDLRQKFDRYRELSAKDALSDEEFLEARKLELSLDEVPDFLALGIAAEYQKAKLELHNKAVG